MGTEIPEGILERKQKKGVAYFLKEFDRKTLKMLKMTPEMKRRPLLRIPAYLRCTIPTQYKYTVTQCSINTISININK